MGSCMVRVFGCVLLAKQKMKEIKFKYYYRNSIGTVISKVFDLDGEIANGDHWDYVSDSPIMKDYEIVDRVLFTSKKDNEGAEIYDGDIVLIDGESGDPCLDVVRWDDESTAFYCLEYGEWPMDMKVIGNIYQNPELLESK